MSMRALLLEDNADDASLVAFELESSGYKAKCERVATEADYRRAVSSRPDIILADYTLPGFNARAALAILRELALDIPLIVVTGSVGEDKAVECMREGAADYLIKDRLARLGQAVKRALEEKVAREARRAAEEELHETFSFVERLNQVSTSLINASPEALDQALVDSLRVLSDLVGVDRALIRVIDASTNTADIAYEWCKQGVPSFREFGDAIPVPDQAVVTKAAQTGQPIVIRRGEYPPELPTLPQLFERDDLDTVIIVPLPINRGGVDGTIGLHFHSPPGKLSAAVLGRLGLFSQIIGNTLARKQAEQRRREAFNELAALKQAAEQERDYLRHELHGEPGGDIVGNSQALKHVLEMVRAVAATKASVLIRGESGVGKELIARAIHAQSDRATGPLVKVNCASIPKELFESEFFGHVKGSFTGALRNRAGRFELAHRGTIFLDEIGEIPLDMQAKLLRVLQESEFERVGDDRTQRVDVRVLAATNRDLEADVQAGLFRRDLYYRIGVFPVDVPALRDRRDDVVTLAQFFLAKCCADLRRPRMELTLEQRRQLENYGWPGNVRELAHVIERAVILSPDGKLRLDAALSVSGPYTPPPAQQAGVLTDAELRNLERDNLLAALDKSGWRVSGANGAAELLGLHPSTLRDRMRALGIQRQET
jgi:transcriptional regulator with GAF, ATPase, and Fis domain